MTHVVRVMTSINKRLQSIMDNSEVVPFDKNSKFIIMSDCHRGQGNTGDNFLSNRVLYMAALEHYYKSGFIYIEIGDGDELWENRKIQSIIAAHSDIFVLLSRFYDEGRMYMLYGNHDIIKKRSRTAKKLICNFYCDSSPCRLFPGIKMPEGLVLENAATKKRILLVHGHQGSFINDAIWPVGRFLVRYLWKPLELVGFTAPTGAARAYKEHEHAQKRFGNFADEQKMLLITGHTHRPVFPQPGEGMYFNDGSCVHPKSITGIEIENGKILLVKWTAAVREDLSLYVKRQVLEGPAELEEFYR